MKVLVTGVQRVDAGKTTFAAGLVRHLHAEGFKPRAGNDYWFDYDDYLNAVERGRLFGKDAKRLVEASGADEPPESINPIHRLWRPAPAGDTFLGPADRTFVLDRAGEQYVLNANAEVPETARENVTLTCAFMVDYIEA